MRDLSTTKLESAQKKSMIDALWKIVLTSGATTHTYEKDRVLAIIPHTREAFSHKATVLLDNSDGTLTDLALEGYQGVISYGMITKAGEEYSAQAPLTVIAQELDSSPGQLTCTLELIGIPNLLAEDRASENYKPTSSDTKTVKTIINDMFDDTMTAFSHCETYTVDWDSEDALIDVYTPKDGFRIYKGGSRLAALRRLLDYTKCVAIFDADGHITIKEPTITGESYDYEYSLADTYHTFFAKAYRKRLVIPNKIQVDTDPDAATPYTGSAVDPDSYAALGHYITQFETAHLDDDDQGDDIAEAMMLKYQLNAEAGAGSVPINVGAEMYDYVKITDAREDDNRVGNIGKIVINVDTRGKTPKWEMRFSFGGWLSVRQRINELETYPSGIGSAGQYFSRLSAKDAYIENLQADNILLYTMDEISEGDEYSRKKALHLDAEGLTVVEDTLYYINYNSEDGEKTFWKSDDAPTDPTPAAGDFWLDTSGETDVLKRYSGSAWVEATTEQKVAILGGTLYRRTKTAILTADGLVILDDVYFDAESTYALALATQISAGKIELTSTGFLINEDGITGGEAESTRVELTANGLRGYNLETLQFELKASDGKAYAGAGSLILDSSGLKLYGDIAGFYFDTPLQGSVYPTQYYFVFQATNNTGFSVEAEGDSWIGTTDGDIELDPAGNDIVAGSTSVDIGTATYYFDVINYSDLVDRTPSPHFVKDALSKIKALETHITTKEKKGHSPVQIETFTRESMPIDLIVPITQRDKDKAGKAFQSHLKRRQCQLDKKKELEGKLKSLKGTERADAQRRIATIDKVIEKNPQIEKLEPQPGISMNATTGLILSAIKELTERVELLEVKPQNP